MLNLRPYNGGPDVEFSELILQFSHHLYFPLLIIKTPPASFFLFFFDHPPRPPSPGIEPVSPAGEAQSPHHPGIPKTLLFKKLSSFYFFTYIFGCAESLLLHELFSSCGEWGLLSRCGVQVSYCGPWLFSVMEHRP